MASMSLARIRSQLDSLRERHKKNLHHAQRGFRAAGDAMVTSSSAALCGYVQGRYGGYKLFGAVPFELVLTLGFHGAAVFGPKGAAEQMHNLGNGALSAYVAALGRGFGRQQRAKAGEPALMAGTAGQGLSGYDDTLMGPAEGGGALSTDDLIRLAQRI